MRAQVILLTIPGSLASPRVAGAPRQMRGNTSRSFARGKPGAANFHLGDLARRSARGARGAAPPHNWCGLHCQWEPYAWRAVVALVCQSGPRLGRLLAEEAPIRKRRHAFAAQQPQGLCAKPLGLLLHGSGHQEATIADEATDVRPTPQRMLDAVAANHII